MFETRPSLKDCENQRNYQALFRDEASAHEPFIAAIFGPYDPQLPDQARAVGTRCRDFVASAEYKHPGRKQISDAVTATAVASTSRSCQTRSARAARWLAPLWHLRCGVRRKALPNLACCWGSSEHTRFRCTPFPVRLPSQYFVFAPDMTLTSAPRVDLSLQTQPTSAA